MDTTLTLLRVPEMAPLPFSSAVGEYLQAPNADLFYDETRCIQVSGPLMLQP